MYDFAHCLSDSIEGITHSICTLEFEINRELYDWVLDALAVPCHPQQIEFARLNLNYTVLSKRKLIELVEKGLVSGWDDPRMPTISGYRRRGYTPEAIRTFCERIGVAKADSTVDIGLMEYCLREDLNRRAPRVMAVLRPLKVTLVNYPEGQVEELDAVNNPEDPSAGTRRVPFGRELFIEREDFMEDPPKKFFRLAPGREVRLRYAYFIRCLEVVKDPATGEVVELRCTYDPQTRGGDAPDGRKVQGDAALGLGRTRRAGRGAPLRPPLHPREPRGRRGGRALHRQHQPRLPRSADRLQARAGAGRGRTGQPLPVRTHGVFLRRPGLPSGPPGLQPLRDAAGHLGQDGQEGRREKGGTVACHPTDRTDRSDGSDRSAAPTGRTGTPRSSFTYSSATRRA